MTAVTAVLETAGASLVLATAMVNESVTEAVPSDTVITTLLSPTSALSGVPASTPVEAVKVAQPGSPAGKLMTTVRFVIQDDKVLDVAVEP